MDDYRAAFPDQICDPSQIIGLWAFFPLYKLVLDGDGECYGVSIASQQFSKGLAARGFRGDVLFANGFPSQLFEVEVDRPISEGGRLSHRFSGVQTGLPPSMSAILAPPDPGMPGGGFSLGTASSSALRPSTRLFPSLSSAPPVSSPT